MIGNLFRNTVKASNKTELLIFITPKIVTEASRRAELNALVPMSFWSDIHDVLARMDGQPVTASSWWRPAVEVAAAPALRRLAAARRRWPRPDRDAVGATVVNSTASTVEVVITAVDANRAVMSGRCGVDGG